MFKWTTTMQIDNGQIDEDHKKLIDLANQILAMNQSSNTMLELKQVIRDLYDYVKYHFEREEVFMQKLNYPDRINHHEKHEAIIRDMNQYLTYAHHLDDILKNFRGLVEKWVINHILEEDKKIRVFMEAKLNASKATGAPHG